MRVLLTGTYSSANKGDLAMQLTAASELASRGVEVQASVPFPSRDRAVYAQRGVEIVPSNRRNLVRATWQILRLVLSRALQLLPGNLSEWLVRDQEVAPFRSADLVVDLSGDMLTDDYGPHVAYSHYLPLFTARLTGTPYVVLAQSIGPFRWTTTFARSVLRNAAFVSVRDPISVRNVADLGISPPTLTADLAFLLPTADAKDVAVTWRGEGLPDGSILGVSVSSLVAGHYRRRNRLAAQKPFHIALADALDTITTRRKLGIVFFPHVTGPTQAKDDRVAALQIASTMQQPAYLVTGDHDPDIIKGMIAQCDAFMGARMHANIAALSSAVPTVAIGYSHKSKGIMQQFGLGEHVIDIAQLSTQLVVKSLEGLLDNAEGISKALADQLPRVKAESARNIEAVVRLLAGDKE
jgi:colanic acid/amylovoran biosynthesis protein